MPTISIVPILLIFDGSVSFDFNGWVTQMELTAEITHQNIIKFCYAKTSRAMEIFYATLIHW